MAEEIGTVRGEMAELRGGVEGAWSAMTTGEEEVTEKIKVLGREVYKLGQGMTRDTTTIIREAKKNSDTRGRRKT